MYIWLARLDVWDSDYNTFSLKDELKGVGGGRGDDGRTKGRRVEVKGERKKQEIVWLTKKSDI